MLFVAEANKIWNTEAGETKYLNAMLADSRKRTYFLSYSPNYYLVGYGDGATIAQQYAMKNPAVWAGMATFGDVQVSEQYMTEVGRQPSDVSYVPMKDVPLPVWCITKKVTDQTRKVVEYWKRANHSEDAYYSNQFANYIYLTSQIYKTSQMDDENIARVLVTTNKDITKDDPSLNAAIWSELNKTRRYLGIANGDLRSYTAPEALGAVKRTMIVDGYTREWYEYVPQSVKANPDKAVPLVVAMHGRSGTGEEFVGRSGWAKVAEERNFIVVFPTSGIYKVSKKAVPNTVWNIVYDDNMLDDLKFIRSMVENVKENHKIDSGRIYATGQSMGSMMSYTLTLQMPDVFVATGSTSGPILDGMPDKNMPSFDKVYDVPYMVLIGDKDNYAKKQTDPLKNEDIKKQLNYLISRYDTTPLDQPATYKNGPYNHRIYYNKNGVPMIHYVNVNNLVHANVPYESWMIYDEFLSKFYRNKDGKLVYEGNEQEVTVQGKQQTEDAKIAPLD